MPRTNRRRVLPVGAEFSQLIFLQPRSRTSGFTRRKSKSAPMKNMAARSAQVIALQAQRSIAIGAEEWKVPDKMVGLIIGHGGEQNTSLRAESGCKVQMASDSGGLPDRIYTLTSNRQEIENTILHGTEHTDEAVFKAFKSFTNDPKLLQLDPEKRTHDGKSFMNKLKAGSFKSRLLAFSFKMIPKLSRMCLKKILRLGQQDMNYIKHVTKFMTESAGNEFWSFTMSDLLEMLYSVNEQSVELYTGNPEDAQDPSAAPLFWISEFSDNHNFGLGYRLSDNSIGAKFADATHLIMLHDNTSLHYIEQNKEEHYYTKGNVPTSLIKKVMLLDFIKLSVTDDLVQPKEPSKPLGRKEQQEGEEITHVPHLHSWFKNNEVIIFHLSNGTFQAIFFYNQTKIILCPPMGSVSVIDKQQNLTVYSLQLIKKYGCNEQLATDLKYVKPLFKVLYDDFLYGSQRKVNAMPELHYVYS